MFDEIKYRFVLLKANIVNSYRIQTAYFFENWASVASTSFYTLTLLLFIKIIYSNVTLFAGYTENEIIFLILFSQLNFYTQYTWSLNNIVSLNDSVRSGELDLILSKPLPSLFFITFRDINLVNRLKDGLPNLILISLLINWDSIQTSWDKVVFGMVVFISGQIAWHCFRFLFALPVFFVGQSSQIFQISGTLENTANIPLEAFTGKLRTLFVNIIPTLIAAQMSVSIILGKSSAPKMLLVVLPTTLVFLILEKIGWIISLRNYSSASS